MINRNYIASGLRSIYVAVNGNKENSGFTMEKPLDSIYQAMALACEGMTIYLAEGIYTLDKQLTLKNGVSIQGAGMGKTVLESRLAYPGRDLKDRLLFRSEGFLFAGTDIRNVTISNLTFVNGFYNINQKPEDIQASGTSDLGYDSAHAAIYLSNVDHVDIHNIHFDSFNFTGIFLGESTNTNIYQSVFRNTSRSDQNSCKGAVTVDNISDCSIHDNIFRDNRGGYGIKSYPANVCGSSIRTTSLTRVRIYNNDIQLRQAGGWLADGWAASNMAIELWNAKAQEVDIFNNTIANCVSLVCNEYYYSEPYSYRIHNNLFLHDTMKPYTCSMSIEFGISNAEVYNNYFEHGTANLQVFHGHTYEDIKVHHNIFCGQELTSIVSYAGAVKNFEMFNNLVYLNAAVMHSARPEEQPNEGKGYFPVIRIDKEGAENLYFHHNLFIAETKDLPHKNFIVAPYSIDTFDLSNNIFWNWPVAEDDITHNFTADPLLDIADMRLSYDSPAYAAGYQPIHLEDIGIPDNACFSPVNEPFRKIFLIAPDKSSSQNLIRITNDESVLLTITGITKNGYIKKNISADMYEVFVIQGENVLNVSENGWITPVGNGIVKITAKCRNGGEMVSSSIYAEVSDHSVRPKSKNKISK